MVSSEWGRSPWRIDVGRLTDAPPAQAPVVVIGGGLTGLGAAYALTRRDIPVALLEAAAIGAGASGRTGAIALEHTAAGSVEGMNDCLPHLAAIVERERIARALDRRGCWEMSHRRRSSGELITATIAGERDLPQWGAFTR